MILRWLRILTISVAANAAMLHGRGTYAATCEDLRALTISKVVVTSAVQVPAGPFVVPGATATAGPSNLPAFCRVMATASPTADSIINIEVWIPQAAAWNGKFQGVGANAFLGAVSYAAMAGALQKGYATASTDTGHVGGELQFAEGHPEKIIDWAYRSIHLMTDVGKLVVRNYMGRWPAYSYFTGCDTGGHQALMEAQRYPDDYDGIVAGVPASNRVREIIGYLGVWKATRDAEGRGLLSLPDLQLVTRSVVAACDKIDGVADGVIDDPRHCKFDPASLLCGVADPGPCLTAAQIDAVKRVYAGTRNPRTGELIFSGWPMGSEGFGDAGQSWVSMVSGPEPRRVEFFKYFVFNDSNWNWRTMDFDRDVAYADAKMGFISAVDPDMRAFQGRGGKLLMYAGWVDPILPAGDVIAYFENVTNVMGKAKAAEFFRFYMVPGMGHCGSGPGTTSFDLLPVLEQWVERNVAPQRVVASRHSGDTAERTRPLCPYPQAARWTGRGSTDDAANFICRTQAP